MTWTPPQPPAPRHPGAPGAARREPQGPLWPFVLAGALQAGLYAILPVIWFFWTFSDSGADGTPPPNVNQLEAQTDITLGVIALLVAAAIGGVAWRGRRREIAKLELVVVVVIAGLTALLASAH